MAITEPGRSAVVQPSQRRVDPLEWPPAEPKSILSIDNNIQYEGTARNAAPEDADLEIVVNGNVCVKRLLQTACVSFQQETCLAGKIALRFVITRSVMVGITPRIFQHKAHKARQFPLPQQCA
jgi:hypothetical protein